MVGGSGGGMDLCVVVGGVVRVVCGWGGVAAGVWVCGHHGLHTHHAHRTTPLNTTPPAIQTQTHNPAVYGGVARE